MEDNQNPEKPEKPKKPMTLAERLRLELKTPPPETKKPDGPQMIRQKPLSYDEETGQLFSFIETAENSTKQFITNIFGGDYIAKYNFSFRHKQKIIKYVFEKNNVIAENLSKEMRRAKEDQDLERLIALQNRMILVAQLADCRNRIGINAYCWGALAGSLCMMLPISIWRKGALGFSLFHIFGSYVSWSNIDRVFDKVYDFYKIDFEEYKKEIADSTVGQIKQTKEERSMQDKRLRKYLQEISKQ